jgi:hypothetical protein
MILLFMISTVESGYTAAPQTALLSDGAGTAFLL